eukprot:COSAG03_NODE_2098_length_3131_cov_2.459433_3_plen_32_part_01
MRRTGYNYKSVEGAGRRVGPSSLTRESHYSTV